MGWRQDGQAAGAGERAAAGEVGDSEGDADIDMGMGWN
jgi:hypothetical protein